MSCSFGEPSALQISVGRSWKTPDYLSQSLTNQKNRWIAVPLLLASFQVVGIRWWHSATAAGYQMTHQSHRFSRSSDRFFSKVPFHFRSSSGEDCIRCRPPKEKAQKKGMPMTQCDPKSSRVLWQQRSMRQPIGYPSWWWITTRSAAPWLSVNDHDQACWPWDKRW